PKPSLPLLLVIVVLLGVSCSSKDEALPSTAAPPAGSEPAVAPLPETASPYDVLPPAVRLTMDKAFTGDLDELVTRRAIRVAVTFNRTHYLIDRGQERGLTYEWMKIFEDEIGRES